MDSPPPNRPAARGSGRRRTLLIVLATSLMLAGAVPFFESSADAIPPPCPDGTPPPCEDPDPTPTTQPPPTTPQNPAWTARVTVLDQNPTSFSRTVTGSWGRFGSPSYSTPSGTVMWTDAAKLEGTVGLAHVSLPAGSVVGFRLVENPSSGRLCRSAPLGSVPATGRNVHVLVAPPTLKTPSELSAMVAGFAGRVTPDPQGAEVTITEPPTLIPVQGGLILTVKGRIWKDIQFPAPNFDASFTYVVTLRINPSTNVADPYEVMTVSADPGVLQVVPDSWDDDILFALGDNPEPDFRSAVIGKAKTAVNDAVSAQADVQWFRTLGYVVSARAVTITPNGVEVQPSLCKVD